MEVEDVLVVLLVASVHFISLELLFEIVVEVVEVLRR
jgi:hypothetical protein